MSFKDVRLGRFASKPKLVCEKMGSGFVEGDVVTDVGLGSGLGAGPSSLQILGPHLRLKMPKVHRRGLLCYGPP